MIDVDGNRTTEGRSRRHSSWVASLQMQQGTLDSKFDMSHSTHRDKSTFQSPPLGGFEQDTTLLRYSTRWLRPSPRDGCIRRGNWAPISREDQAVTLSIVSLSWVVLSSADAAAATIQSVSISQKYLYLPGFVRFDCCIVGTILETCRKDRIKVEFLVLYFWKL